MNESAKTLFFVAAAVLVGVVAWTSRPKPPTADAQDVRGQLLFGDTDPTTATGLDLLEFDEATSTVRPFQVAQAQVKGKTRWSIPSHDNYPADAKDHLGEVAAGLMGLKILDVAGTAPGDHATFGVSDPGDKDLQAGATGVGTRVTMRDKSGKELLAMIIGKEVADRPGLRYVRRMGEDTVYIVTVKTDKLSGKFEDWIEKDLLKLTPWDIKELLVRDHSVDVLQGRLKQNGEITLSYDDAATDQKWKITKDEKPTADGKWVPIKMAADEEVNSPRLDELTSALRDLKIVDVRRKPAGLTANLKGGKDLVKSEQDVLSLQQRGFFFAAIEGTDQVEIFSNNGEIRSRMKDGVEYVLRFGGVAGGGEKKKDKKDAKDKKDTKDKKDDKGEGDAPGMNRYLFVMAEFRPEAIAKPVMAPLPEEKKEEPKKEEAKKDADKKDSKDAKDKKDDKAKDKKDDKAKPAEKKDPKKAAEELKAERDRVEKENKRKQDEYDAAVKKGQERVKELNERFADWYYVISEDMYRKIHVSRDQIVKKKEKKDDKAKEAGHEGHDHEHSAGPVGQFEKLKNEGPGEEK